MARQVAMQFGKSGTSNNNSSSVGFGAVLIGTDSSANTSQSNFELTDSLQNYRGIQVLALMNWASTSNIRYLLSPIIPTAILDATQDYGVLAFRQPATGSDNSNLQLHVTKVDDTHLKLEKGNNTYDFRTVYIYGIK